MKTLILIRHADAEPSRGEPDSKRKLSEKGLIEAKSMAIALQKRGYTINKIFSSPSERTKETTETFASIFQLKEDNIKYFDSLYLGDTLQITETINWLQENVEHLAIVGHNPGVTNYANDVTGSSIDTLHTASVAIIKSEANNWQQFEDARKTLVEVLSPNHNS